MRGVVRWKRYVTACNLCGLKNLRCFRQNEAQIPLKTQQISAEQA